MQRPTIEALFDTVLNGNAEDVRKCLKNMQYDINKDVIPQASLDILLEIARQKYIDENKIIKLLSRDSSVMPTGSKPVNFLCSRSSFMDDRVRRQVIDALEQIHASEGNFFWKTLGARLYAERRLYSFVANTFQYGGCFDSDAFLNQLSEMREPFTLNELVKEFIDAGLIVPLEQELQKYEGIAAESPQQAEMFVSVLTKYQECPFDDIFVLQITGALEYPYQGQPFWRFLGQELYAQNRLLSFVYNRFYQNGCFDRAQYFQLLSAAPCKYKLGELAQRMIDTKVEVLKQAGERLMQKIGGVVTPDAASVDPRLLTEGKEEKHGSSPLRIVPMRYPEFDVEKPAHRAVSQPASAPVSSHAQIVSQFMANPARAAIPVPAPAVSAPVSSVAQLAAVDMSSEESILAHCSAMTKEYLRSFDGKISHSQIIAELKLTPEELAYFDDEEWTDAITFTVPNRPVMLNEKFYEFSSLPSYNGKDPHKTTPFSPLEIGTGRKAVEWFEKTVAKIKEERQKKLDGSSVIERYKK